MVKKAFRPSKKERVESEDDEVVVKSDRSLSVDSEEQALRGTKRFKEGVEQDKSGKNKLAFGEFHRYNRIQKKPRKQNTHK